MVDQIIGKAGGDRPVARLLAIAAAGAPVTPVRAVVREAAGADTASLSNVAAQLAAKPPVDVERVQQIKRAIANGTFPILPATIADRLLAARYEWLSHDET